MTETPTQATAAGQCLSGQYPCDCEWCEYGSWGIDATHPGHPESGRCLHCKTKIAGKPLRAGKWIYCDSRCHDARLLVVPVRVAGGAMYLPGDEVDTRLVSAGSATYPSRWS